MEIRERTVRPLAYRLQHLALPGERAPAVEPFGKQIADSKGRPSHPYRVYDTLAALERKGTIDGDALAAGRRFEEHFQQAALNSLHARDLSRVGGGSALDMNDVMLIGRDRIAKATAALGGHGSPAASALWAVLGQGQTIKEFAESSQLGGGRSLDQRVAKGIFVAALYALAAHYGFSR